MTAGVERTTVGGRPAAWLAVEGPATGRDSLEAGLDALAAALDREGFAAGDVVRNRLFAATRAGRDAASAVRFERYAGPVRCATSSYVDASRFPGGDGARFETLVVAGAAADKIVVEREPLEPPCHFVASGDLVVLSGLTSTEPDLARQLAHIRARLGDVLALASARLGRPVQATVATAFVHRSVADALLPGLGARLGLGDLPLAFGRCDGYSKPGKLLELEVDAAAG